MPTDGHVEEVPGGTRDGWRYRVIGRNGTPVHHTDDLKDAERYLECCRKAWKEADDADRR